MSSEPSFNRRGLLKVGASSAGAFALAGPLAGLMSNQAMAASTSNGAQLDPAISPYGPIVPVKDQATGLYLLQLPKGFTYNSFSWTGDMMSDGNRVGGRHDGMAVVSVNNGQGQSPEMVLIRNHEIGAGPILEVPGNSAAVYDGANAGGGCSVLRVGPDGKLIDHRNAIGGTLVNCAGGATLWGSWLTCEETTATNTALGGKKHGYVFEVAASPEGTKAQPIIGMGRFSHEATSIDPTTSYVYLTEDSRNVSGLYRYKPNDTSKHYGALQNGGTLQAAKIVGVDRANLLALAGPRPSDVQHVGQEFDVEWVNIAAPDADPSTISETGASNPATGTLACSGPFKEAREQGALRMCRGEGIWWSKDRFYYTDTNFGYEEVASGTPRAGRGLGAVWEYYPSRSNPERGKLKLIYAAAARVAGNNPDNIVVSPRGGVLYCEDGEAVVDHFGQGNRLMGLTHQGEAYIFAKNNVQLSASDIAGMNRSTEFVEVDDHRGNEFCGATFDPTGRILFVNIQTPGITFAISGPWARGNL